MLGPKRQRVVGVRGETYVATTMRIRRRDERGRPLELEIVYEDEHLSADDPAEFLVCYVPARSRKPTDL